MGSYVVWVFAFGFAAAGLTAILGFSVWAVLGFYVLGSLTGLVFVATMLLCTRPTSQGFADPEPPPNPSKEP